MSDLLLDFISDMDRRRRLASRTKSNPSYLWQVATGRRQASPDLAREIESATADIGPYVVPKESVRPDLWETEPSKRAGKANQHRRRAN